MPRIAVNTKFLSSLGPEWEKYVIFLRQAKNMHHSTYGLLYDYLKPHEKEVDRERILRAQIAKQSQPDNQQLALYAQQNYPSQPATQPTASKHTFTATTSTKSTGSIQQQQCSSICQ